MVYFAIVNVLMLSSTRILVFGVGAVVAIWIVELVDEAFEHVFVEGLEVLWCPPDFDAALLDKLGEKPWRFSKEDLNFFLEAQFPSWKKIN